MHDYNTVVDNSKATNNHTSLINYLQEQLQRSPWVNSDLWVGCNSIFDSVSNVGNVRTVQTTHTDPAIAH